MAKVGLAKVGFDLILDAKKVKEARQLEMEYYDSTCSIICLLLNAGKGQARRT